MIWVLFFVERSGIMVREEVDRVIAEDVLAAKQQMEEILEQVNDRYLDDLREAGILLSILSELFSPDMRWFHSVRVCKSHVEFELNEYTFFLVFHEKKMLPQLFINNDPDLNFAFFIGVAAGSKELEYQYVIETSEGSKTGNVSAYSQPDASMRIKKICTEQYHMLPEQIVCTELKRTGVL